MRLQTITEASTTEDVILSLDDLDADPKMSAIGVLHVLAQMTLTIGLCRIINLIVS